MDASKINARRDRPTSRISALVLQVVAASEDGKQDQGDIPDPSTYLPIFVLQPVLPGAHESFHIFEPRYRLMLKNCLSQVGPAGGFGEFGMCWPDAHGSYSNVGTMMRITRHMQLPEGRSHIECVAVRRFQVLVRSKCGGLEPTTNSDAFYNTALVDWFDDVDDVDEESLPEYGELTFSTEAQTVTQLRHNLVMLHSSLLQAYPLPIAKILLLRLHGPEKYKSVAQSLDESYSVDVLIEAPQDDAEFVWWLLGAFVPLPPEIKAMLIKSQSLSSRIASATIFLEQLLHDIDSKKKSTDVVPGHFLSSSHEGASEDDPSDT